MGVTEQVMANGDWSITLTGDLPRSVTDPVATLWSHLIITPARLPPEQVDAQAAPPPTVEIPDPVGPVKNIAVIVGDTAALTGGDWRLDWALRSHLGHTVTYYDDADAELTTSSPHNLVVVAPSCDGATLGSKYDGRGPDALPVLHMCAGAWITSRARFVTTGTVAEGEGKYAIAVAGGDSDFTWPGVAYDDTTRQQLHANPNNGQYVPTANLLPGATRIAAPDGEPAAAYAWSIDVGESDATNGVMTARAVGLGTTPALIGDSVWGRWTDLVGAAIEWLAPTTSTQPPVSPDPLALWVIGKSKVKPTGLFADPTEEASAAALARRGHAVTRVQAATLTGPPLTTDCAVVVHLDGHPPDWRWLRGTAVDAAPIWHANTYFWGDGRGYASASYYYGAGLSDSVPGSGRALADLEVRATSPVTWTDGHTVGADVTMFGWNWVEWMTPGTSSSTVLLADPADTSRTVGFVAAAGATNTYGDTLTAHQACIAVFPVGFHAMTEAGLQVADDILAWLGAATPGTPIDPTDPDAPPVTGYTASTVMDNAIYTGIVQEISRRRHSVTLAGPGLAAWLGDGENGQVPAIDQPDNGSFRLWIDALLPPGIERGLVTQAGDGVYTATYTHTTRRKALDDVCDFFGAEWRLRPTGRLDAGYPADIYGPGMAAVALDGIDTVESDIRAMADASIGVDWDAADYLTGVAALGTDVTGTATVDDIEHRDLAGGVLDRRSSIAATEVTVRDEADRLAAAELARAQIARHIKVTCDDYLPTRFAPCGSTIGVWAPALDGEDLANPVIAAGRTLHPVAVRVRRVRWPIRRGCGVYLQSGYGAGAGRVIDITDHVEWETGPATYEVDTLRTPAAVLKPRRITAAAAAGGGSTSPAATHLWVGGGMISGGAFTDATEEAAAVALAAAGYTVTRRENVAAAPLTSDCDVYVMLNSSASAETAARAIATNAAPILALSSYALANAWGELALNPNAPGTNDTSDRIRITNTTAISFSNGWAVGDDVTISSSPIYMERLALAGAASGAFIWSRSLSGTFAYVGYGWPTGTTNLAGQTTTARIATWHIFPSGLPNLSADGWRIFNDLVRWLTA